MPTKDQSNSRLTARGLAPYRLRGGWHWLLAFPLLVAVLVLKQAYPTVVFEHGSASRGGAQRFLSDSLSVLLGLLLDHPITFLVVSEAFLDGSERPYSDFLRLSQHRSGTRRASTPRRKTSCQGFHARSR
jgi:hypothetical protein